MVKAGYSPVVLVTGCSEGGIGHALCVEFISAGCTVFATARNVEKMKGLESLGAHLLSLDVTSADAVRAVVDEVIQTAGFIDILVNNAGMGMVAPAIDVDSDTVRRVYETNVFSVLSLIKEVVPHMASRGRGQIVNIGSITAFASPPFRGIYASSKAAVHALTDSLRLELKPLGIRVMLVVPGSVVSKIGEKNYDQLVQIFKPDSLYKGWEEELKRSANMSKASMGTPTSLFAKKAVQAILRNQPRRVFVYGKLSGLFLFLARVPLWVRDLMFSRIFGLKPLAGSSPKNKEE